MERRPARLEKRGHTSRAVGPCEGVSLADEGSRPGRACRCACRRPCAPRREGETGPWIAARKKKAVETQERKNARVTGQDTPTLPSLTADSAARFRVSTLVSSAREGS